MCTHRVKRGSIYYFRRVIPAELRPHFGNRSEWMESLKTKDREEAGRLARQRGIATDMLIKAAKAAMSAVAPDVTSTQAVIASSQGSGAFSEWELENAEHQAREAVAEEFRREELGPIISALEAGRIPADAAPDDLAEALQFLMRHKEWEGTVLEEGLSITRAELKTVREEAEKAGEEAKKGQKPSAEHASDNTAKVPLLETHDAYARDQRIKPSTAKEWRAIIENLIAFLGHDDAARITTDDLHRWKERLLAEKTKRGGLRDPRTVRGTYIAAIRATLNWAVEERKLSANVATNVVVRVPKKLKLRERDFTADEARAILSATLIPAGVKVSAYHALARRWIPWLCAYTGARVNEMSQLRGEDVRQIGGVWTIRITPEAGTVKANAARTVPLHSYLIEQGFLKAIEGNGDGPLFYDPSRQRKPGDGNRYFKKVGEHLAKWVRDDIGITDPNLQPNHGWRHTFKTMAMTAGISERIADAIQGHAPATVSRSYGSVPLAQMAEAIEKLPRFTVSGLPQSPPHED